MLGHGMRAVVQRVREASVTVEGREVGPIGRGPLVLLGVGTGDSEKDAEFLVEKVANLRIFPDEAGGPSSTTDRVTFLLDSRKGFCTGVRESLTTVDSSARVPFVTRSRMACCCSSARDTSRVSFRFAFAIPPA